MGLNCSILGREDKNKVIRRVSPEPRRHAVTRGLLPHPQGGGGLEKLSIQVWVCYGSIRGDITWVHLLQQSCHKRPNFAGPCTACKYGMDRNPVPDCLLNRVSQPQHHGHLGPDNSVVHGCAFRTCSSIPRCQVHFPHKQ